MNMKLDPLVLAEGMILPGDDVGTDRPNDNVLVEGISGGGKSTSILLPTLLRQERMNPVLCFAKEEQALDAGAFLNSRGYEVDILNRTVRYDPLDFLRDNGDRENLAAALVSPAVKSEREPYWNNKAQALLKGLLSLMELTGKKGLKELLALFEQLTVEPKGDDGFSCRLDDIFDGYYGLNQCRPDSQAVREYRAFRALPAGTAACVRDGLAAALSAAFPESVRERLTELPSVDFEKTGGAEKYALIVVSEAGEEGEEIYTNLFFRDCFRQLHCFAQTCPGYHLPRPVRIYFDDFGVSAPIHGFQRNIAFMREDGISVMLLVQSLTQLEAVYGAEGAAIIRQNIPTQVYLPGGFDLRTCEEVSRKMNVPLEEVLFSPLGSVFVMRTGHRPMRLNRFPTLEMEEYREFCAIAEGRSGSNREY